MGEAQSVVIPDSSVIGLKGQYRFKTGKCLFPLGEAYECFPTIQEREQVLRSSFLGFPQCLHGLFVPFQTVQRISLAGEEFGVSCIIFQGAVETYHRIFISLQFFKGKTTTAVCKAVLRLECKCCFKRSKAIGIPFELREAFSPYQVNMRIICGMFKRPVQGSKRFIIAGEPEQGVSPFGVDSCSIQPKGDAPVIGFKGVLCFFQLGECQPFFKDDGRILRPDSKVPVKSLNGAFEFFQNYEGFALLLPRFSVFGVDFDSPCKCIYCLVVLMQQDMGKTFVKERTFALRFDTVYPGIRCNRVFIRTQMIIRPGFPVQCSQVLRNIRKNAVKCFYCFLEPSDDTKGAAKFPECVDKVGHETGCFTERLSSFGIFR